MTHPSSRRTALVRQSSRRKAGVLPRYPVGFSAAVDKQARHARRGLSPNEAWQAYRALRLDRRIGYAAEPDELLETWQPFTEGPWASPNLWTDAYLCAFANAARLTLVTLDAKIPSRADVSCLLLSGSP